MQEDDAIDQRPEIGLETVTTEASILGELRRSGALHPWTTELIGFAFDRGAYVAGGFGTIVARHFVLKTWTGSTSDRIELRSTVRNHMIRGDIDVWFPDQRSSDAFFNDGSHLPSVTEARKTSQLTKTGIAVQYCLEMNEETDNAERVQAIKAYIMPREEQVRRFDIYNAMCAFDDRTVIVPERWRELEVARCLHVHTWKHPWTVGRFFKWFTSKDYKSTSPETAHEVKEAALKTLEWYSKLTPEVRKTMLGTLKSGNLGWTNTLQRAALKGDGRGGIAHCMKRFLPSMDTSDLLEVSAYLTGADSYDNAMGVAMKRMLKREPT